MTSNKPLKKITGTYQDYSAEDYSYAAIANLILKIGPERINTPLHQNWNHRSTALMQTKLDDAAQKCFSVLPMDLKFD